MKNGNDNEARMDQSSSKYPILNERTALFYTRRNQSHSNQSFVETFTPIQTPRSETLGNRADPLTQSREEAVSMSDASDKPHGKSAITGVELLLLNSGSVARDHLASERTYLAYVRTSLGLASAGVALMQLLHLGQSTKAFAAPLGAITIFIGIMVLLLGTQRFFLVQRTLVLGYYPVSTLQIALISFLLGGIVVATFAVILAGQTK